MNVLSFLVSGNSGNCTRISKKVVCAWQLRIKSGQTKRAVICFLSNLRELV
jgi:hypothetical protein